MSKKNTKAAETTADVVEVNGFTFDVGLPIPASVRTVGKSSELANKLTLCPVGASFLVPVARAENADAAEAEKIFKEHVATARNRISGAVRRVKQKQPHLNFEARAVADDVLGYGVRVYRHDDIAQEAPRAAADEASGD